MWAVPFLYATVPSRIAVALGRKMLLWEELVKYDCSKGP